MDGRKMIFGIKDINIDKNKSIVEKKEEMGGGGRSSPHSPS